MYLLKVVQVGLGCVSDPLVPSIIQAENGMLCNVTKILLNHVAVPMQVQILIESYLICDQYLYPSLEVTEDGYISICTLARGCWAGSISPGYFSSSLLPGMQEGHLRSLLNFFPIRLLNPIAC